MPVVDVQPVMPPGETLDAGAAGALADALGRVFGAPPGRVWVRLRPLPQDGYAENGGGEPMQPVFVTLLHADGQQAEARAAEAAAVAQAVGACLGREPQQVHVEYAAPGRGRIAFGGALLR